ncbi:MULTISPECIES: DUF6314 family protein [Actinoalloteichus]|uniref:DUF6314 domain-containing protein n=1 Tax=Actinoalloteichus caeruleus DSM 43889 TaxID=1120930 RepID=A0ABT1JP57_ACTCY|nr:DUF6314 family protein [Actinoalloteichus caeruleus]MCP2334312.1 hypothetical protein [Actinoalloteichus caeruleus DSM 43889]
MNAESGPPPAPTADTDLRGYLLGRWRLDRVISTPEGGELGTFTGSAEFTDVRPALLRYREEGELRFGTHVGPAYRTLWYRTTGAATAEVTFDHGGFFHTVDLRGPRWNAEHLCVADLYRVEYLVRDENTWAQRWRVTGPAKNHVIATDYHRGG